TYFSIITMIVSLSSFANADKAPKSFDVNNKKAVYVDFISAKSDITFDVKAKDVFAKTTIIFDQLEEGHPIFDLVPEAKTVTIDDQNSSASNINSPDGVTTYKLLNQSLKSGRHT